MGSVSLAMKLRRQRTVLQAVVNPHGIFWYMSSKAECTCNIRWYLWYELVEWLLDNILGGILAVDRLQELVEDNLYDTVSTTY